MVKVHSDPFKTKGTLKGKGTPAGLRNISFMAEGGEVKTPEQIAKEAGFPMTPPSKPVINGSMAPKGPGVPAPKGNIIGVRAAAGGAIHGPGGPTADKVPAMLSDGEYVLPAKTVAHVGVQNLDAMVQATTGKAPPARSGLRSGETAIHAHSGVLYGTPEGIISEDPNVGSYNRNATRMAASPQIAGAASAPAAPAATLAAPAAPQGMFGKMASGLRGFGGNILKAATPAILAKTAVDTGVSPTSEIDQRVQAIGGPSNAGVERTIRESPAFRGAMTATPFVGPALNAAADLDPKFAADIITRTGGAIMSGLGLNGTADRRIAANSISEPSANTAMPQTPQPGVGGPVRGSVPQGDGGPGGYNAMMDVVRRGGGIDESGAMGGVRGGDPVAAATAGGLDSAALDAEIGKIGANNPFNQGVRNRPFYQGGQEQLAGSIAAELGQRSRVKAMQAKYGTDATILNNQTNARVQMLQMQREQANTNQGELDKTFDRTATVPVMDKNGQVTGSTVDPALRNRAQDFARSAVAGWDQLSPEQRSQGFEQVRHKFLLQELMNSGEANIVGKFMSSIGLADELGGYTAQPLKVKNVRTLGVGDLGQKASRLTSVVSGRPYVEFENGKLYPLQDVVNTPELKGAFESRLKQSPKAVQDQYKKYTTKGK